MLRSALVGTAAVLLSGAIVLGLLWVSQRHLIYLPASGPVPSAASVFPRGRDVVLETDDGLRLGAWYVAAARADAPAVLVASGNAGHRGLRAPLARALA